MKKNLFLIFLLIVSGVIVNAKSNQLIDKNEISFSFTNCPVLYGRSFEKNVILLDLHYNRRALDYLSIGAYMGLGEYDDYVYSENEKHSTTTLNKEHLKSLNIGSSVNLHILPLFMKSPFKWVDVFVKASVGVIHFPSSVSPDFPVDGDGYIVLPAKGTYFDSSITGGIKLYPTRSLGIFGEYGYRYFEYYKGFHSSFGISVRF
jgi:hypothetical protein